MVRAGSSSTGWCGFGGGEESAGAPLLRAGRHRRGPPTRTGSLPRACSPAEIRRRDREVAVGALNAELHGGVRRPAHPRVDAAAHSRAEGPPPEVVGLRYPSPTGLRSPVEPIARRLSAAPSNGGPARRGQGRSARRRFAARPSGTENVYKIYASRSAGPIIWWRCRPRRRRSWAPPPPPPPVGERLQRREAPEPSPDRRRRRRLRHRSSRGHRLLQLTREGAGDQAPRGADRVPPGAMPPPCRLMVAGRPEGRRRLGDHESGHLGDLDRDQGRRPRPLASFFSACGSRWRAASAVGYPRSATNRGEDLAIPSPRAFAVVAFP